MDQLTAQIEATKAATRKMWSPIFSFSIELSYCTVLHLLLNALRTTSGLLLALWNVTRNLLHDISPNNRSSQPPTTQQAASGRSVLTFGLTSTHCWKWHTITSGGQRGWKSDWKPYLETKSMVKLNQIVAGSADHEWMSDHQIYDPSINNALVKNRLLTTWLVYAVPCGL